MNLQEITTEPAACPSNLFVSAADAWCPHYADGNRHAQGPRREQHELLHDHRESGGNCACFKNDCAPPLELDEARAARERAA